MKALKIIGSIAGLAAVAVFVFWFGWLRAPSPESVCAHMSDLLEEEVGSAMPESERDACIRRLQAPEFGKIPYAKQMKCLKGADSLDELDRCEA